LLRFGNPPLLCLWLELVRLLRHSDVGACHGDRQLRAPHVIPGVGQTTAGRPHFQGEKAFPGRVRHPAAADAIDELRCISTYSALLLFRHHRHGTVCRVRDEELLHVWLASRKFEKLLKFYISDAETQPLKHTTVTRNREVLVFTT
jgi:hypothetical protein